jgi:hypothetical protein
MNAMAILLPLVAFIVDATQPEKPGGILFVQRRLRIYNDRLFTGSGLTILNT